MPNISEGMETEPAGLVQNTCRVCDWPLEPIFSLGDLYVSNFPAPGEPDGIKAPLELGFCQQCSLLQLRHTMAPEALYRTYWYRSGTNESMRLALADIANKSEKLIHLQPGDAVLDIGCNDGTLLSTYRTPEIYKIGVDPAENLAPFSRQVADHVITGFFEAQAFFSEPDLARRRPKIITSIAMFYDLKDPKRFVADIKEVLHPDGLWVVQMSYLPSMLKQNAFDNICHEHLEYYSLQSFQYLLDLFDFEMVDVELNDVNGGSFRVYIRNRSAAADKFADPTYLQLARENILKLQEWENRLELNNPQTYLEFSTWVQRLKDDVVGFIQEQLRQGKKVYVYGASTKGNTLLQYFGLDRRLIAAAAERNPDKWGKVTVGTHIPIVSEEEARADRPDYFLVLPWHFIDSFLAREKDYLLSGGRFILPMPHFSLI